MVTPTWLWGREKEIGELSVAAYRQKKLIYRHDPFMSLHESSVQWKYKGSESNFIIFIGMIAELILSHKLQKKKRNLVFMEISHAHLINRCTQSKK